ncbi:hypothetical protein J558_1533 [Acinetobacter baumannii 1106579]|nr:hypothetical protein ACIN5032_1205 [Acinetobacter baumannii OIFC032]EKP58126.1 hypothetical protein ACINNAV82_1379 [Acinetobacter baumannii Naval-82]EXE19084.1 hypothetical protein J558_1533 [Acinetobacter baumannii 1106579]EXE76800.1 hypothetical protein J583_2505 [Acinetobacter baumannii 83444]KMV24846.1 hypothetical protein AB987_0219 [Acinetobacter baumannii]
MDNTESKPCHDCKVKTKFLKNMLDLPMMGICMLNTEY